MTNNTPKVSIIIPCYNHGQYIDEAIESARQIKDKDLYEIIIIDDGSTDEFTQKHLHKLAEEEYNVIFQKNAGVSAARNTGISVAKGEFILPLDADNKIRPEYVYRAMEIFSMHDDISVVHGNCLLFGDAQGIQKSHPLNLQRLMLANYIDVCAVFRKKVWQAVDGFDVNMRSGLEDWEFWMHAAFKGFKFYYIDEVLFDYRVLGNSRTAGINSSKDKNNALTDYLIKKHSTYFGPQYIDENIMEKFNTSPAGFMAKLVLKKYFPQRFNTLVSNGKLRKYI